MLEALYQRSDNLNYISSLYFALFWETLLWLITFLLLSLKLGLAMLGIKWHTVKYVVLIQVKEVKQNRRVRGKVTF